MKSSVPIDFIHPRNAKRNVFSTCSFRIAEVNEIERADSFHLLPQCETKCVFTFPFRIAEVNEIERAD